MAQAGTNRDEGYILMNFIIDSIPQFITTKVRGRKSFYPKVPKGHSFFAPRIEEEIIRKTIKTS